MRIIFKRMRKADFCLYHLTKNAMKKINLSLVAAFALAGGSVFAQNYS